MLDQRPAFFGSAFAARFIGSSVHRFFGSSFCGFRDNQPNRRTEEPKNCYAVA
jgi:hypothetical protein